MGGEMTWGWRAGRLDGMAGGIKRSWPPMGRFPRVHGGTPPRRPRAGGRQGTHAGGREGTRDRRLLTRFPTDGNLWDEWLDVLSGFLTKVHRIRGGGACAPRACAADGWVRSSSHAAA